MMVLQNIITAIDCHWLMKFVHFTNCLKSFSFLNSEPTLKKYWWWTFNYFTFLQKIENKGQESPKNIMPWLPILLSVSRQLWFTLFVIFIHTNICKNMEVTSQIQGKNQILLFLVCHTFHTFQIYKKYVALSSHIQAKKNIL